MGINEYIQVGSQIKEIRISRGLSQREVAKMLDIPYSTYSNYENNNREPSFETLSKIARILDVSVAQLMNCNDEVVADDRTRLLQQMMDYLDEIDLSLEQDEDDSEKDRYQIVSGEKGTVDTVDSFQLIGIFEDILADAERLKDRYIIKRLSAEFLDK